MKYQAVIFSIVLISMIQISYNHNLNIKLGLKELNEVTITEDNFEEIINSSRFDYSTIKIVVGEKMLFSSDFESFLNNQSELKSLSYEDKEEDLKNEFFSFLLNSFLFLKNLDTLSLNDCKLSLPEASNILYALKTLRITNIKYLNLENNLILSENQELDDSIQFYELLYYFNVKLGVKINLSRNNCTNTLSLIDLFLIYQESSSKNLIYIEGSINILEKLKDLNENPSEIIDLSNNSQNNFKLLIELNIFSQANSKALEVNLSGNTIAYEIYTLISKLITKNTQRLIFSNVLISSTNKLLSLFEPNSLSLNYIDLTNNLFVSKNEFMSLITKIDSLVSNEVEQIIVVINDMDLIKLSKQIENTTRVRLQFISQNAF